MDNKEIIEALRCPGHNPIFHYCDKEDCPYCQYSYHDNLHRCNVQNLGLDAAAAIEAAEKRIVDLEDDLRNSTISNPERFKIYGYSVKDLILFAEVCKRNDVQEEDMKQAAWNLELAVRAYNNATIERIRTWADERGTHAEARCVPNFEKAYAEMRGEHDVR